MLAGAIGRGVATVEGRDADAFFLELAGGPAARPLRHRLADLDDVEDLAGVAWPECEALAYTICRTLD